MVYMHRVPALLFQTLLCNVILSLQKGIDFQNSREGSYCEFDRSASHPIYYKKERGSPKKGFILHSKHLV